MIFTICINIELCIVNREIENELDGQYTSK